MVDVGGEYFSALSSSCRSARPSSSRSASTVRSSGTCLMRWWPSRRLSNVRSVVATTSARLWRSRCTVKSPASIRSICTASVTSAWNRSRSSSMIVDQLAIAGAGRRARQQIARGRLHRRERRLELVRQRVQHGRPQLAALLRRLGARRGFLRARPFEPDGRQVRDRVQHRVAEPDVHEREAADGRAAELNRNHDQSGRVAQRGRPPGDLTKLRLEGRQLRRAGPRHGVGALIVQADRLQLERLGDVTRNRSGHRRAALGQKERPAERVQTLEIALPARGVDLPLPRPARELAGDDRRHQERDERHPVLRIGDREACRPEAGRRS